MGTDGKRIGLLVGGILGGVGFLLLVIGIILFTFEKKKQDAYQPAEATIVDFDRDDYPYVRYVVDGKEYEKHLSTSSSSMYIGQRIKIAYDPANPHKITMTGFMGYLAPFILGIMSVVFIGFGVVLLRLERKARKKEDEDIYLG